MSIVAHLVIEAVLVLVGILIVALLLRLTRGRFALPAGLDPVHLGVLLFGLMWLALALYNHFARPIGADDPTPPATPRVEQALPSSR
jgi:hypothetical protein